MQPRKVFNYALTGFFTLVLMSWGISHGSAQSTLISSTGSIAAVDPTVYTVYIPNSFTPNADGVNDRFTIYSEQLKRINLKIYDQTGQEVFNTSEMDTGWDGNHHNREMHQDTYLYRIEAEYINGYTETLVGPLNLIR
jgi:gliding motility-associated-like protein